MTTDLAPYRCDEQEARDLTEQIKGSVERVYLLLLRAREGRAHVALGYPTWEAYVRAEFDMSRQQSYRLLDQGEVIRELTAAAGVSPMGDITEREARDLKPHLAEATDAVREAVADVPEPERPAAAAAAVRQVREKHRPQTSPAPAAPHDAGETPVVPSPPTGTVRSGDDTPVRREGATRTPQSTPVAPASAPVVHPVAAARAEVARQPAVVAGKGIERLRTARLTFEAAGSPAEVIADLVNDGLDVDRGHDWLEELDAALPLLNDLAAALRRRNLRSVTR